MPVKFSAVVIDHPTFCHLVSSRHIIHHKLYDTEEAACKGAIQVLMRYQIITHGIIKSQMQQQYFDKCDALCEADKPQPPAFCYRRKDMRRKIDAIATRKQLRTFVTKYVPDFNDRWTYQIREL